MSKKTEIVIYIGSVLIFFILLIPSEILEEHIQKLNDMLICHKQIQRIPEEVKMFVVKQFNKEFDAYIKYGIMRHSADNKYRMTFYGSYLAVKFSLSPWLTARGENVEQKKGNVQNKRFGIKIDKITVFELSFAILALFAFSQLIFSSTKDYTNQLLNFLLIIVSGIGLFVLQMQKRK